MAGELDAYHDAWLGLFRQHFGDSLETVHAYLPDLQSTDPEAGLTINTPALLVEIEKTSQGLDVGDGRTAVECQLAIHCILGAATPNLQRELRNFGVEIQRILTSSDVCLGPQLRAAQPEDIHGMPGWWQKGGVGGYDSWVVTFAQTVWIGESVWDASIVPERVILRLIPPAGGVYE